MAEIISLLTIGFAFGLRHAFDADHIAAVSVLAAQTSNRRKALLQGIFWGLGHTATLLAVGIFVLFFGFRIPPKFSGFFEFLVAILLIGLGIFSCIQTVRSCAHSHPPFGLHKHPHSSFLVGIIHGLAGSVGVFVLIISMMKSPLFGLLYILIFGLGTIIGMAFVSFFIGFSALYIKKYAGFAAGVFSFGLGIFLLFSSQFF